MVRSGVSPVCGRVHPVCPGVVFVYTRLVCGPTFPVCGPVCVPVNSGTSDMVFVYTRLLVV
jgi:hypothetical protein